MVKDKCRLCQQPLSDVPIMHYDNMPSSAQSLPTFEQLDSDKPIQLSLYQCEACGLIQHTAVPVPYYKEVIRATAVSSEMTAFRDEQFSDWVKRYDLAGKKVLEIGCGKGEFMNIMQSQPVTVFGIEHGVESVNACLQKGFSVEHAYADESATFNGGPFDAFFILNFLEHVPDLRTFLNAIRDNLKETAIGLVEVPNFDMILKENLFSEIIRDHVFYFTENSLKNVLEFNGFEVIEIKQIWHKYIISAVVRKRKRHDLTGFHAVQQTLTENLNEFINKFPARSVVVWGAGHQSLAILALSSLENKIAYVVDSADFKQNKFTPTSHLPIYPPKILKNSSIKAVIVIAGSFSEEVVKILRSEYDKSLKIAVVLPSGLKEL